MAKVPKNWERRLVELAAIHGVTDFLLRGRLTKAESKVFYTILNKLGKPAARTTVSSAARLGGTALSVGRTIAMRHPYITAGAVIYYGVKNREELADLAKQGWEVVEPVAAPAIERGKEFMEFTQPGREQLFEGMQPRPAPIPLPGFIEKFRPRKKSKYNRAVSAAMKAVKASTKGGKKGKISSPKTVFKTVSKAVSKVNKGAKTSAKGITGIAARAARKILGKPKKKPKKRSKGYTIRGNV
jgi:hypothetical protein